MIVLDKVTIQAGQFRLEEASLEVATGDYGMLMGRTGCGKTTILEAIAGLKPIVSGSIRLGDHDVTALKPGVRRSAKSRWNKAKLSSEHRPRGP